MKIFSYLFLTSIFLFGIGCLKDEPEKDQTLKSKLLGKWIEVFPCDSCNVLAFSENDTIYQKNKSDITSLSLFYQIIADDSIKVVRNWDIEPNKKTTNHKIVFYTNDTIVIKQFIAVDFGVTGFENIKLYKMK